MPAAYSKSPLVKKLVVKPHTRMVVLKAPEGYRELLGELPADVTYSETLDGTFDWIQIFVTRQQALYDQFPTLKQHLAPNGILWICFPRDRKKTDLSRNAIMPDAVQIPFGLTPVSNVVVSENWTGYRLKHFSA